MFTKSLKGLFMWKDQNLVQTKHFMILREAGSGHYIEREHEWTKI